jgi:hypothetical protein
MEVVSPGANGQVLPPSHATTVEPMAILQYIIDICEVVLGASEEDLARPESGWSKAKRSDTLQRAGRFAAESQVVLYAQKDLDLTESTNGVNGTSGICITTPGVRILLTVRSRWLEPCYPLPVQHILRDFIIFIDNSSSCTYKTPATSRSQNTHLLADIDYKSPRIHGC